MADSSKVSYERKEVALQTIVQVCQWVHLLASLASPPPPPPYVSKSAFLIVSQCVYGILPKKFPFRFRSMVDCVRKIEVKPTVERILNGYRMNIKWILDGSHLDHSVTFYVHVCMYILALICLHV